MYIHEWQWDDENLEHLIKHGISPEIIEQVGWGRPKLRRNKKRRRACHYMIGPDDRGTMWTICIQLAQKEPEIWRAITGWRSDKDEQEWYRRAR